jgi:hypothetical protein
LHSTPGRAGRCAMIVCALCNGFAGQHFDGCPSKEDELALIRSITDPLVARIEALEAKMRDTIPSPPIGDSHSGAIVVPRGSSRPPAVELCYGCRMFECVCFADLPSRAPTDGSDGEGGP